MRRQPDRITAALVALGLVAATAPAGDATAGADGADAGMTMRGDQEGTAFRSLTVEGEDRVHFEIERPSLELSIDPAKAPGLEWGTAHDVLDRTVPDGVAPFLAGSRASLTPFLGRPWLRLYAFGEVARFRPQVENVEQWRLLVVDSRGREVTRFEGKGKPPAEIAWDGRTTSGQPAPPGLTYSYVLEARDKAGNKRNLVGQGFELPPYRVATPEGQMLAFAGGSDGSTSARAGNANARMAAPLLLEAASWLNQVPAQKPVRITVAARSFDQANTLATGFARSLTLLLLGDPARVQVQACADADASERGSVQIAPAP
jgi:hypothetical protein